MSKKLLKTGLILTLLITFTSVWAQPGGGGGNPGGGPPPSTSGSIDSGVVMLIITVGAFALYRNRTSKLNA